MNSVGIGAFFNLTELRPDVHLPCAAAAGGRGPGRRARPAGAPARRRAAVRARRVGSAAAGRAAGAGRSGGGGGGSRRRARRNGRSAHWTGGYRPYDLVKECRVAIGVVLAIALLLTILFSSPDDRPSTIAEWSRQKPVDFVTTAVTELDGSSGARLRAAVQPHGDVQHIVVHPPAAVVRRQPSDQHRPGLRARPAASDPRQPGTADRDPHLPGRVGQAADRLDDAYDEGARQGEAPTAERRGQRDPRRLRPGADDDDLAADVRAERRARRRAADQQAVLPDRLHQAAAVPGRRRRCSPTAPKPSTCSATSGG